MAPTARHLFIVALAAALAAAAPRAADAWSGGRFFFSKTTRAAAEPAGSGSTVPSAADPNAAPAFSRPSTGGSGRGYGLYGRPEENYPPDYFRRGVHRNPEKLKTTAAAAADVPATAGTGREAVPVGGDRSQQYPEDGSGRGRPPTNVPASTTGATEEEAAPVAGAAGGGLDGVQPYPENGSGRGRPPWYYTAFRGGRRQQGQEEREDYDMSDTRLYQNGRYYYDVDAGRYGYGRESNPMPTRPEEEDEAFRGSGSGYGRPGGAGGDRRWRYGNAVAGTRYQQYGDGDEFGNGAMDRNSDGFQGEAGQNGRYIP